MPSKDDRSMAWLHDAQLAQCPWIGHFVEDNFGVPLSQPAKMLAAAQEKLKTVDKILFSIMIIQIEVEICHQTPWSFPVVQAFFLLIEKERLLEIEEIIPSIIYF